MHACIPSYLVGRDKRITSLRHIQAKLVRPDLKNKIQNERARGMALVEEPLPSVCEALGLIPNTSKLKINFKQEICILGSKQKIKKRCLALPSSLTRSYLRSDLKDKCSDLIGENKRPCSFISRSQSHC
jgi:hypothetical protein